MKHPRILIDKRGRWFQDGIPITHRWTYLENNRNLRRLEDGSFAVVEGDVRIPVEVEDTPFVIVSASLTGEGIAVGINDGTSEVLGQDAVFSVSSSNVPYAIVKQGMFNARFLRRAYYAIAFNARPLECGGFMIENCGKRYLFPLRDADAGQF